MYILIDSSHKLHYTGVVSGPYGPVNGFRDEFLDIYQEHGINPKYHWSDLTRKKRGTLKKPLVKLLQSNPKVHLNVFEHKKPQKISKKDWYLFRVPGRICQRLEPWMERG